MPKNFELNFDEKTFVLKNMNPERKSDIIKLIITPLDASKSADKIDIQLSLVAESAVNVPKVLWSFIKDEDKQTIGTYEKFADEIDSDTCDQFVIWSLQRIKESNDFFLQEAQKAAPNQE